MLDFLTILIAIIALLLIASVLIQNSKGGGVDATLGGGAQQMMGAARSTDFIEKATWVLVGTLLVLCLVTSSIVGGNNSTNTELPADGTQPTETGVPLKSDPSN
jgi:preprotein translocase subunit SecG